MEDRPKMRIDFGDKHFVVCFSNMDVFSYDIREEKQIEYSVIKAMRGFYSNELSELRNQALKMQEFLFYIKSILPPEYIYQIMEKEQELYEKE